MAPRTIEPGHRIVVTTKENVWYGTVTRQTSATDYSAPYNIEAPSQTALFELIRIILGMKGDR